MADVVALYNALQAQRVAPITKVTLLQILLPAALPLLALAALQLSTAQ